MWLRKARLPPAKKTSRKKTTAKSAPAAPPAPAGKRAPKRSAAVDEVPEDFALRMDYDLELVTDPDTLLPRHIRSERTIETPDPARDQVAAQTDIKQFTYRYLRR